jgi:hypothetical protein
MRLPGFAAEDSLYKTSENWRGGTNRTDTPDRQTVIMQAAKKCYLCCFPCSSGVCCGICCDF